MNTASVDLIYLDPPFNSKADYAAPIGSKAAGAAFKDTWTLTDVDVEWINLIEEKHPLLYRKLLAATTDSDKAYLTYMAARLLEMRRLLKPTGSLYLHCNQEEGHHLKLVMDAIFGQRQFINEIIWNYGTPSGGRSGGRKPVKAHENLLVYASEYGKHTYHRQFTPYSEKYKQDWFRHKDGGGRAYQTRKRGGVIVRQYLDESPGIPLSTVWSDIMQIYSKKGWFPTIRGEDVGYPTQKPLALLLRVIEASSNPGEMVLDPFCGCATTLVAAEERGREWVGIDISEKAAELVVSRVEESQGFWRGIIHRSDIPHRTDLGSIPPYNSPLNRRTLYGQQEGYCAGCDTHFESRHLEVDHIISRRKGGTDHIDNLQLLCSSCNRLKGDRGMDYLRAKLRLGSFRQRPFLR